MDALTTDLNAESGAALDGVGQPTKLGDELGVRVGALGVSFRFRAHAPRTIASTLLASSVRALS